MGIFPTFYAHWRLNRMVRAWRKANKLIGKVSGFILRNSTAEEWKEYQAAIKTIEAALEKVTDGIEAETISELKDNL